MTTLRRGLPVLAACLGFMSAVHADGGWQRVGGEGERHFVLVDVAQSRDAAVYRQAASSLCKPGRTCIVMYWVDPQTAASRMPLSAAQAASLVAQYTRTPVTGHDRLVFRCRGGEPPGSCLR